ncbi:MAG TPA: hypothetical protein VMW35_14040 [Myxococcota bacterium]|jgi:F0F1-type ATP synthase epsilon subunit|nr:hypothetical protein [Myxococcota bacterium]
MAERALLLVVRTPRETVAELALQSLRVASDTGQVGLRPGCEASVLAVEPGLALAATAEGVRFLATAGGVLRCDGRRALLLSPVAVVGDDPESVIRALGNALATAAADAALRRAIERLETGVLRELRRHSGEARAAGTEGGR